MAIASLKDLYLDELANLYDAEGQMIRALQRLADAAHAPELKETLVKHGAESRLHLERLQLIFTHWGETVRSQRCAGLAGIVQEADDRVNDAETEEARDAAIVGVAQRIEHYEIAAYGCARTYARRLNRIDEARLLKETLDEEGRADRRLTGIAEARINDDARFETDFVEDEPPAQGLRYVDVARLASGDRKAASFEIRNEADDALGTLDGLVVDAVSGEPRYLVVARRTPLVGRRFLLPIEHVRFDSAGVFRVDIDKDVAALYSPFDRAELVAMRDAEERAYEGRLLDFFHRQPPRADRQAVAGDMLPDWLTAAASAVATNGAATILSDRRPSFIDEHAPRFDARAGEPADMAALNRSEGAPLRETTADASPTPPHGEKLR